MHLTERTKKRASKPKVRTGCATCKIRHLKCDERKPRCLRCEQAWMDCEYVPVQPKPKPKSPPPSTPRYNTTSHACTRTERRLLPLHGSVHGLFEGNEALYFDNFQRQVVKDLSADYCQTEFWTSHVLRQSMNDECVRQSALALGALSQALNKYRSVQTVKPGQIPEAPLLLSGRPFLNKDHVAALSHHIKAVSLFRRVFAEQDARPTTILVVTLLFIAFELLQGNIPSADKLMTHGIIVLKDFINVFRREQESASEKQGDDEIATVENILPRLCVTSNLNPFCLSQHRNCFLLSSKLPPEDLAFPTDVYSRQGIKNAIAQWCDFFTRVLIFCVRMSGFQMYLIPRDVARTYKMQREFLRRLARWRCIFNEMALKSSIDLRLVRLHMLFCRVFLEGCADVTEISFDGLEDSFKDIVACCESLMDDPEAFPATRIHFTMGVGLAPPLILVAVKCRVFEVRMKAIEVLRRLPWREGAWDTGLLVAGYSALAELEESGRDENGSIPPEARWIWCGATYEDEGQGCVRVTLLSAIPSKKGLPRRIVMDLHSGGRTTVLCRDDKVGEVGIQGDSIRAMRVA